MKKKLKALLIKALSKGRDNVTLNHRTSGDLGLIVSDPKFRTYRETECVSFLRTKEKYGGLSNMAAGFPIDVNGVCIRTSEALYQACRFPHKPEVQRLIIEQQSPMTAKMMSKPYRVDTRHDWDKVRVNIMRWCLRAKLVCNWNKFSELLLSTGDKPIVEHSRKDDFWGAKPTQHGTLIGMNVLGRLLMELRQELHGPDKNRFRRLEPPNISQFLLYGRKISYIERVYYHETRNNENHILRH